MYCIPSPSYDTPTLLLALFVGLSSPTRVCHFLSVPFLQPAKSKGLSSLSALPTVVFPCTQSRPHGKDAGHTELNLSDTHLLLGPWALKSWVGKRAYGPFLFKKRSVKKQGGLAGDEDRSLSGISKGIQSAGREKGIQVQGPPTCAKSGEPERRQVPRVGVRGRSAGVLEFCRALYISRWGTSGLPPNSPEGQSILIASNTM